eukprot:CAMPEP_0185715786 /NCGR_PEP_ID=MMETSP1164-20130828/41530_1 /TAXON_ID=1104430 /ORGANISM="Chrysoreinhardia sp, Strain CCMP2950" /LENGTH=129 /DNA_ID=CAMNT_0028383385 /DNA_START=37 /DNA_END=423 /DNA_ORIENTATION=-
MVEGGAWGARWETRSVDLVAGGEKCVAPRPRGPLATDARIGLWFTINHQRERELACSGLREGEDEEGGGMANRERGADHLDDRRAAAPTSIRTCRPLHYNAHGEASARSSAARRSGVSSLVQAARSASG